MLTLFSFQRPCCSICLPPTAHGFAKRSFAHLVNRRKCALFASDLLKDMVNILFYKELIVCILQNTLFLQA